MCIRDRDGDGRERIGAGDHAGTRIAEIGGDQSGRSIVRIRRCPVSYTHLDVYKRQGYHYGLTDKTDLVTNVAYQKLNPDLGSNLNGYSAEVGVRGAIAPKFEGYAMAGYEDYKLSLIHI